MQQEASPHDEAFLELDEPAEASGPVAVVDPTPGLPTVGDAESFLEVVDDGAAGRAVRPRVVTEDDLRMVTALADDALSLLGALWPSAPDLLAELPTVDALRARVALARTTLNQVTRRGAEWRARAEVAGAALTRRLDALRAKSASRAADVDAALHRAACDEMRAWHRGALEARVRAEAAGQGRVYADGVRRLADDARRRGMSDDELRAITERLGVELLPGEVAPWTPCTALPGAPRTLDGVASALVSAQAQSLATLRDGGLVGWLRANRAPDALVLAAVDAQDLAAEAATPAEAAVALWSLAWALGRDGVVVDGHAVTAPETLLAHLRAARLHASQLADAAPSLARWFRQRGDGAVAAACEAVARGDAHGAARLRWSLGEPLRLGDRSVTEPSALAREALSRYASRAAALEAWRDGALRAWLDALPRAKRDALWADELSRPPAHEHDEGGFWRGVYRRVPRAALRVHVDGAEGRVVRFQTVADLRATARVAAVWEPLKSALRSGELHAWLAVAAPGLSLDTAVHTDSDDVALHELLAALGHAGLVLPWGRAGHAVTAPADLVAAWKRGWSQVEAQLAHGHVTAWLTRFHPGTGVAGVTVERAVAAWKKSLGAGRAPPGVAALRLALLCGLDELPLDPQRPMVRAGVRGYRALDGARHDAEAWEPLWGAASPHRAHGTLLLWVARQVPAFGVLAASALTEPERVGECTEALHAAGVPVATEALATEHLVAERESARLAAEREAARLAAEREAAVLEAERERARLAAEREEARATAEREGLRREVDREIARLEAERDAARLSLERERARLAAERELARAERDREVARLQAERDAAGREAERAMVRLAMERDEARREVTRATARAQAERDEARIEAERARLERDIAKFETAELQRRARRAQDREAQESVEREASQLHTLEEARREAAAEAARLRALEEQCRREAELENERAQRLEDDARREGERESARFTALADEARRLADADAERLEVLEEEARREAGRRAEEAAALALQLADDARRRDAAEREAADLARALVREREAAREASWAARRVAAEREIARLTEAERRARELAVELARAEASDEGPTAQEIETLTEIEGSLDDAPDVAAIADDEPDGLPERREVRAEDLIASQPVTDEGPLARVRAAVEAWAAQQPPGALSDAARVEVLDVTSRPAFEAHVTTRMESRELAFVLPPWRDEDAVPVPPEATSPGASVDPWALVLPEVDAWTSWRAEYLLDAAPIVGPCGRCDGGRVECAACEGGRDRTCARCGGRVRVRCARCAGAGEVPGAKGPERCPGCEGRRDQPCAACTFGRVPCLGCRGRGSVHCARCKGRGEVTERVSVVQRYEGVAAVTTVRGALPDALADEVQARNAEPVPVVHIETPEIDPHALAREIPHGPLAEAVAQLLADEVARATANQRPTRQRLLVRKYPVYDVRYRLEGETYALVVHGLRDLVHAEESPFARRVKGLVARAREAAAADDVDAAVAALVALREVDDGHAEGRAAAAELGERVLAMALRGELFAARDASQKARAVAWPECLARLVEAERVVGERLQVRSPWALAEEARAALDRGRDDRCIERLAGLAALDAAHPEGRRVAEALGARLAEQALALAARGDVAAAAQLVARGRSVAFAECAAALAQAAALVDARRRASARRRWLPWAVVVTLALLLWALLR